MTTANWKNIVEAEAYAARNPDQDNLADYLMAAYGIDRQQAEEIELTAVEFADDETPKESETPETWERRPINPLYKNERVMSVAEAVDDAHYVKHDEFNHLLFVWPGFSKIVVYHFVREYDTNEIIQYVQASDSFVFGDGLFDDPTVPMAKAAILSYQADLEN